MNKPAANKRRAKKFRERFIKITTIFFAGALALSSFSGIHARSENQKIEALLYAVLNSRLTFIRNGREYSAGRAVAHLRMKRKKAGARVRTAEDFIVHLASKSYLSGRPYYVRLPDGRVMKAADWLRAALARIEKQSGTAGK